MYFDPEDFKGEGKLKPKIFLLSLMVKQRETSYGNLLLYMTTAARLLYVQRWKDLQILTMEE